MKPGDKQQTLENYFEIQRQDILSRLRQKLEVSSVTDADIDERIALERDLISRSIKKIIPEYPEEDLEEFLDKAFSRVRADLLLKIKQKNLAEKVKKTDAFRIKKYPPLFWTAIAFLFLAFGLVVVKLF